MSKISLSFNSENVGEMEFAYPQRKTPLSSAFVLARILEGGREPGILSDFLRRGGVHPPIVANQPGNDAASDGGVGRVDPAPTLQTAIDSLSPNQKKILTEQAGDHLCEFLSLSEEASPKIFYAELLQLGRELENSDHLEIAKNIYSAIVGAGSTRPPWQSNQEAILQPSVALGQVNPAPTEMQQQAQERLEIIKGGGSVGAQLDFSGRRMVGRILEPSGFVGMGLGLGASKFTEAVVFSRLSLIARSGAPTLIPKILTSGLGKRLTARVAAFMTEVPSFTLGGKLTRSVLGKTEDYSYQALKSELTSSALFLGGMKTFGIAGSLATRGITNPFQAAALRQASTLLGIMTGHLLEMKAGLKEYHGASAFLVDSLTTLLDLHVMGEVTDGFYGERFKAFQQRMAEGVRESGNRGIGESGRILQDLKTMWDNLWSGQFATVDGARLPQLRLLNSEPQTFPNIQPVDRSSISSEKGLSYMTVKDKKWEEKIITGTKSPSARKKINDLSLAKLVPFPWPKGLLPSSRYRFLFNNVSEELGLDSHWHEDSNAPQGSPEEIAKILQLIEQRRLESVKKVYERNERVSFYPSLNGLNPAEKMAVNIFAEQVAPLINEIYSLQEDPNNLHHKDWIHRHGDPYSKLLFERHQSDTVMVSQDPNTWTSLFPYFPDQPPINGMISRDVGQNQFVQMTQDMDPNNPVLAPDTIVLKTKRGTLKSIPMAKSPLFAPRLKKLAVVLRKIGSLNDQGYSLHLTLKKQLLFLARSFETGKPSDIKKAIQATLDQKAGPLRIILGPFSTFAPDNLKRAFVLQVGIRDFSLRQRLSKYEDALTDLKGRFRRSNHPKDNGNTSSESIDPIYQILTAGHIRSAPKREVSGNSISGSIYPDCIGGTRLIHLEVHEQIASHISTALPKIIDEDLENWDAKRFVTEFVANHEGGHLVDINGNEMPTLQGSHLSKFGKLHDGLEETKADLAAIVMAKWSSDKGDLSTREARDFFRAYVGYQFSNRYRGVENASSLGGHDFGRLLQVGLMFREGVFSLVKDKTDPTNFRIHVDYDKLPMVAEKFWLEISQFQIRGKVNEAQMFAGAAIENIPPEADHLILKANSTIRSFFMERYLTFSGSL